MNASLRRTLLAWLLVPLMLVAAAGAGLQYWLAVQPAQEALDRALADATLAVGNLLRAEQGRVSFVLTPESEWLLRADRLDTVYFAVLGPGGDLVAGDAALARLELPAGAGSPMLADVQLAGHAVRAAALRLECGPAVCEVRMAETLNKRQHIERDALAAAAFTLALIAAASAIAIAFAVRRGLRPLAAVQQDIGRRSLDDLSALDAQHAPAEIRPLLEAINQLFARLRDAATAQRAFIADAAHQLRTPLANLRTETELAVLEPHPPELDATLQR
ncbi:MAG TPA: sensor histidine kinase N-terminal domain-containing protein, partial [Ramlibacter sp.]|nr:sensor histidine kinase N-terminal domain-containing protein [Ramlibacter sp.]